jgi:hypothetical protein
MDADRSITTPARKRGGVLGVVIVGVVGLVLLVGCDPGASDRA